MLPNAFPVVMIFGLMGHLAVEVDIGSMMTASVALGVAVDDTIHFLHHFKLPYDETGHRENAIQQALKHGGRAIIITSIVLIAGIGSQVFAQMASIARFGFLVATTIGLALLADLIFAPAVLRLFYPMQKGERGG